MTRFFAFCLVLASLFWQGGLSAGPLPLSSLGAVYRPDVPFPQFYPYWHDSALVETALGNGSTGARVLGGSLHVYVKNAGATPLTLEEVRLDGIRLNEAIVFSEEKRKRGIHPASLFLSKLPASQRQHLVTLGEPVWWRVDPQTVSPGGAAEVTIRLRRAPQFKSTRLRLEGKGAAWEVEVPLTPALPQIASLSFSPTLKEVTLYFRHPKQAGARPIALRMDGQDVTSMASLAVDPKVGLAVAVLRLREPLAPGSYHCFQGHYADGSLAIAGLRAYSGEFAYGVWGSRRGKEGDEALARAYLQDIYDHNINVQMEMVGSAAVAEFLKTDAGQAFCRQLGIRRMVSEPGKGRTQNPFAFFLVDEPDCGDYRVSSLPPAYRLGSLAQALVERSADFRQRDPLTPQLLNVDMTYKPDNWYIYGQLPDIFAADPYYQERLRECYWDHPERLPLYVKPTFVYAVGTVAHSACAPRPLHLILNSVCRIDPATGRRFRFGTPEEKRVEVYYALAAGARGLSFWWYTPQPNAPCHGCGAEEPEARALWREIGLLGAEVRTLGSVLTRSCPAPVPVQATRRLWVRSLVAGLDTLVLLVVNDDHANDRLGTVVRPVENATLTVDLPTWLAPRDVFEVTDAGLKDASWKREGGKVALNLGTVQLTRLLVLTADTRLRPDLENLYRTQFAERAARLRSSEEKENGRTSFFRLEERPS